MLVKKPHNVAFAWFGIIAIAVFTISWICAAALDPAWVFGKNTLSDFGVSDTDAKYFFNYGCCMLTAIFLAIFGFASTIYSNNKCISAGGILLVIGAVLLFLVGIITKDVGNGDLHNLVAYTMGFFIFIAVCLYAGGFWMNGHEVFAAVPIVIVITLMGIYVGYNLATFEAWAAIGAMIWIIVAATDMMLSKPNIKDIA
ncbi:MAG: DUF998 domain-containing protein [Candidatus Methanogranum gryphiswaldense]|nr:MAG: DUF998 domain-containing protein [Candidatus Methanogranum sp. U3.2.1]